MFLKIIFFKNIKENHIVHFYIEYLNVTYVSYHFYVTYVSNFVPLRFSDQYLKIN